MEWKRYTSILRRWLWLLLLAACMSAVIGWAFTTTTSGGRVETLAPVYVIAAALLGLVWALAGVFGIEYATDNIRVPEDLDRISSVPLLGVIPTIRRGSRTFLETPGTEASSAYRAAATGLLPSSNASHYGRTILVCPAQETPLSAQAAANLGMSLARLGHPTLLIDADRMNGQLTRAMNLQGQPGFADALSNPSSDVMLHLVPSVPNMYVLPAGASPSVEPMTFSLPYLRNLVERSGASGSMIMVAGPSAAPSSLVAMGLAKSVHDVVLVAVKDETKRRTLRRSVQSLQQSGAHLAGILLMERPASYKYDDMPAPAALRRSSTLIEGNETAGEYNNSYGQYDSYGEYEPVLPVQSHSDPYEDDAEFVHDEPQEDVPSYPDAPPEGQRSRSIQTTPIFGMSGSPILDLDSLDAGTTPPPPEDRTESSIDLSGLDNLAGPTTESESKSIPNIDFSSLDILGGELAAEQGPKRNRVSPLLGYSDAQATIPVQQPAPQQFDEQQLEEPSEAESIPGFQPEEDVETHPGAIYSRPEEAIEPSAGAAPAQHEPPEQVIEPAYYEPALYGNGMATGQTEVEVEAAETEEEPTAVPVEPAYSRPVESEPEVLANPFFPPAVDGPAFWLEVDPISSWANNQPADAGTPAPPEEVSAAPPLVISNEVGDGEVVPAAVPVAAASVVESPLQQAPPLEPAQASAPPEAQAVSAPARQSAPSRLATVIAKWLAARRLERELARSKPEPRRRRAATDTQPVGTRLKLAGARAIHSVASARANAASKPKSRPGTTSASSTATAANRDRAVTSAPPTTVLTEADLVAAWLQSAEQARLHGNMREAKELVNRVLDLDPRNEDAWHMRLQLVDTRPAQASRPAAVPAKRRAPSLRVPVLIVTLVVVAALAVGIYAAWPLVSQPSGSLQPATATSTAVSQVHVSPTPALEDNTYDVSGAFLTFWGANGGAKILGNPISPRIQETASNGTILEVQYFERARLELHPENADPNSKVALGRIGSEVPITGTITNPLPPGLDGAMHTFKETGFDVPQKFYDFWQANNGSVIFGYPLTPVLNDVTLDGKPVVVQYFERARFEYHPEAAGTPNEVQLTNLGSVVYSIKHPR